MGCTVVATRWWPGHSSRRGAGAEVFAPGATVFSPIGVGPTSRDFKRDGEWMLSGFSMSTRMGTSPRRDAAWDGFTAQWVAGLAD